MNFLDIKKGVIERYTKIVKAAESRPKKLEWRCPVIILPTHMGAKWHRSEMFVIPPVIDMPDVSQFSNMHRGGRNASERAHVNRKGLAFIFGGR